jgi:hypothetical protein
MKEFIKKYRKTIILGLILLCILFIVLLVEIVIAVKQVAENTDSIAETSAVQDEKADYWEDISARNLYKNINWIENQLLLSKSDSISLGVNLADSTFRVQLKGTVLFQTKILHKYPVDFLKDIDSNQYFRMFGKPFPIEREDASILKKTIKNMKPGAQNDTTGVNKTDEPEKDTRFIWEFEVSNQLKIIVFGVTPGIDSVFTVNQGKDVRAIQWENVFSEERKKPYVPILYVWLKEQDAKAVFRALPPNGRIIIKN